MFDAMLILIILKNNLRNFYKMKTNIFVFLIVFCVNILNAQTFNETNKVQN